jgi:Zn-finger nucleic acid-binding protein
MTTSIDMVCPKCGGRMLSYERTGIVVEQCQACRGIFLDLGELERLIDAEGGGWSGRVEPPSDLLEQGGPIGKPRPGRAENAERERMLRELFGR